MGGQGPLACSWLASASIDGRKASVGSRCAPTSYVSTRLLGTPCRLGFQQTLRRSVSSTGKSAKIVA
eukprot:3621095-Pyramimonas_sp.AAC.1